MGRWLALIYVAGVIAACGDDGGTSAADAASISDAHISVDAAPVCIRPPGAADAVRKVVIAHPYDDAGMQYGGYEVYELSGDGQIASTGVTFEMHRAFDGVIAFTPDGKLGFASQDDGTVGIFRINGDRRVDVLDAAYDGEGDDNFYATSVVMGAGGSIAYVLNSQWRENGGGIYALRINCDDTITYLGAVAAAKLPYGLHLLAGDSRAVVIADDVLDSATGGVHLLSWGDSPGVLATADLFSDDQAIIAGTAVTADGHYVLAGDNSQFSGVDNRVAVASIAGDTLTAIQVLTPIEDPIAIVTSPDNDAALVVSGLGDALFELDYAPTNTTTPFSMVGELSYSGAGPQLPAGAVLIDRGGLRGRVVIAENTGIRQVQFESGAITDLGATSTGSGLGAIVGAIGVQP